MIRHKITLFLLIINSFILFHLSCCSTIGLGLGTVYDNYNLKIDTIPRWDILACKKGTQFDITLDTESQTGVTYHGFQRIDEQVYRKRYSEFREKPTNDIILPMLEDSIEFKLISGEAYRVKFKGFDYRYLIFERTITETAEKLPLSALELIVDNRGNTINGDIIRRLMDEGRIPVARELVVQTKRGLRPIFMDGVKSIKCYDKKIYGKITGFALGIVFDILILNNLKD
jgi:hypothetical protein